MGDRGCAAIAKNPTWSNLEILFLNGNQITNEGAKALGRNSLWTKLTDLHLSNNQSDEGATAIAANISWMNLKTFDLAYNLIRYKWGLALGEMPLGKGSKI